MKFKTSTRAIKEWYHKDNIFQCGYCDFSHLFALTEASGYTCGVYGWNFDLYEGDARA